MPVDMKGKMDEFAVAKERVLRELTEKQDAIVTLQGSVQETMHAMTGDWRVKVEFQLVLLRDMIQGSMAEVSAIKDGMVSKGGKGSGTAAVVSTERENGSRGASSTRRI